MRLRKETLISQGFQCGVVDTLGLFWFCCVRVCDNLIPSLMTEKGNIEKSPWLRAVGGHSVCHWVEAALCGNKAHVLSSRKHVCAVCI